MDLELPGASVFLGDCIERMKQRPAGSVQMCVTSPPYYGLRNYGVDGQIGLEETPEQFIAKLVEVFREVRRLLSDDGTCWVNIGDSYGAGKQLLMIPARVAIALQADGWVLRQEIIWEKPNPMPENVTDRPTRSHESLFLLAKRPRYYFNSEAFKESAVQAGRIRNDKIGGNKGDDVHHSPGGMFTGSDTRNRRSVWTIATKPYKGAHFAVFPPALIQPCILAGSRPGDVVLDCFNGSGTTGEVSLEHGRLYEGFELNAEYIDLTRERLTGVIDKLAEAAKPSPQMSLLDVA